MRHAVMLHTYFLIISMYTGHQFLFISNNNLYLFTYLYIMLSRLTPLQSRIAGITLFSASIVSFVGVRSFYQLYRSSFTSSTTSTSSSPAKREKSSLYTKTGDKGTSSLYNGERRIKSDPTFEALGNNDELNAVLGIAREYCSHTNNGLGEMILEIQSRLFDVGAAIATPVNVSSSEQKLAYTRFPAVHTLTLERWIDELDSQLPLLKNFVIPSGGYSATHLNLARSVCRRCERSVVPLIQSKEVDEEVGKYLNRLSDFLFAAMRTAVTREKNVEHIWRKTKDV